MIPYNDLLTLATLTACLELTPTPEVTSSVLRRYRKPTSGIRIVTSLIVTRNRKLLNIQLAGDVINFAALSRFDFRPI